MKQVLAHHAETSEARLDTSSVHSEHNKEEKEWNIFFWCWSFSFTCGTHTTNLFNYHVQKKCVSWQ